MLMVEVDGDNHMESQRALALAYANSCFDKHLVYTRKARGIFGHYDSRATDPGADSTINCPAGKLAKGTTGIAQQPPKRRKNTNFCSLYCTTEHCIQDEACGSGPVAVVEWMRGLGGGVR